MRNNTLLRSANGLTLIELIVVLSLLAILSAIALPPFLQWRASLDYRTTASGIFNILKQAKSRTITNSLQCRVEFQAPPTRQYRMTQGDRAANSANWGATSQDIIQNWTTIPTAVSIVTANTLNNNIEFNTNGTANLAVGSNSSTIQIQDNTGAVRFTIQVDTTGRIAMRSGS